MKTELKFDRFIEIFIPGAILTIGLWYLHRPFLMVYFPAIASDATVLDLRATGLGARSFILLLAAVCSGVLITYLSDVVIVGLFQDASGTDKARRRLRRVLRIIAYLLTFGRAPATDPRVHTMKRYLASPRKEAFIDMLNVWCQCDSKNLESESELIMAHQHIITRLCVISADSRKLVNDLFRPVQISSGILVPSALLIPGGLAAFATSYHVIVKNKPVFVHSWQVTPPSLLLYIYSLYCARILHTGVSNIIVHRH